MSDFEKPTIGEDVAKAEFNRFADSRKLDRKRKYMDDNDARDFDGYEGTIVEAIIDGSLVIDDSGLPIFTTVDGQEIQWRRPKASALIVMDKKKKDAGVAKICASMAEITKVPDRVFATMDMEDFNVCMAIYSIFLA